MSPSPSPRFSVEDVGLVFKAQLSPQGVVPPTPLFFTILGHYAASLTFQVQLLRQHLFGAVATPSSLPLGSSGSIGSAAVSSPPRLIGQKCQAPLALIIAGKRRRVLDLVPASNLMDEDL